MLNPNQVFTNDHEYIQQLENLKAAIFYFVNNADDLEIDGYIIEHLGDAELVAKDLEKALEIDY